MPATMKIETFVEIWYLRPDGGASYNLASLSLFKACRYSASRGSCIFACEALLLFNDTANYFGKAATGKTDRSKIHRNLLALSNG